MVVVVVLPHQTDKEMKIHYFSLAGFLIATGGLAIAIGHAIDNGFDSVSLTAIGTAFVAGINALLPSAISQDEDTPTESKL